MRKPYNNPPELEAALVVSSVIMPDNTIRSAADTSLNKDDENLTRLWHSILQATISELLTVYDTPSLSRLIMQDILKTLDQTNPNDAQALRSLRLTTLSDK